MGRRGPAPLPSALRVLHGETRPSRLNRAEPRPGGQPHLPSDLSPAGRRVWRRVQRDYGALGVLTAADSDILRAYCEAVVRYGQAATLLERAGPLVRGARGAELIKNPLHQIVRDNADLVRLLAREIGLTPAARTALRTSEPAPADPMAELLADLA